MKNYKVITQSIIKNEREYILKRISSAKKARLNRTQISHLFPQNAEFLHEQGYRLRYVAANYPFNSFTYEISWR